MSEWAQFESIIETSNIQYRLRKQALIQKIATPWKVIRGFEPHSKKNIIYRAFPEQKSTVDFGGTAKGYSIWFDAKKSDHPRYLPLSNIKEHQIKYLNEVDQHGGKAFFLVYSKEFKKTWLLWIQDYNRFIKENTRKSIPWEWIEENCKQVHASVNYALDYLKEVLP
jgi:recombination protein U